MPGTVYNSTRQGVETWAGMSNFYNSWHFRKYFVIFCHIFKKKILKTVLNGEKPLIVTDFLKNETYQLFQYLTFTEFIFLFRLLPDFFHSLFLYFLNLSININIFYGDPRPIFLP